MQPSGGRTRADADVAKIIKSKGTLVPPITLLFEIVPELSRNRRKGIYPESIVSRIAIVCCVEHEAPRAIIIILAMYM